MAETDKLAELIEHAACSVNMLSTTDLSEVETVQDILDQVHQAVAQLQDGPAELLTRLQGTTDDASEQLKGMLRQESKNTEGAIEAVSQAVTTLQELIGQITGTDIPCESGPARKASTESAQAAASEMVIPEEDIPLVMDFITEAGEHFESAEAGLLELENKPGDSETLNQIFRAFHTIKGMAGFLNLTEIGTLSHAAENLLDLARKGQRPLTGAGTDLVFASIDMLKTMIAGLKQAIEQGSPVQPQQDLPQLLAALKALAEGRTIEVTTSPPDPQKDKELDTILAEESKPKKQAVPTQSRGRSSDEKIKVSTARLDNLINMAGELVIAQLMVGEEINKIAKSGQTLKRKVSHQGKIVRELQELSMSMRMVPIQGVFQKMARLVRDLSHKAGKTINFTTTGEETELDRRIIDNIADPLVHMVRNSVDHGIEAAEERLKAGKQAAGNIELRAFHQAGNIVIEIEDDGKGLEKDRILQKAIDSGIVEPHQQLSDEEIFRLVFHAGLSTSQRVTDVSGRGVGMDVVKKNIELLQGKIDIRSEPGKGTLFAVRLPLTLAIIDGQVVKVGDQRYIIPINSIIRSVKPKPEHLSTVQNRAEMVMVRGELTPMVRLHRLFAITPRTEDPTEAMLIVVQDNEKKCCLLVDELLAQQQVVIKNLGGGMGKVRGISGGAIMGDSKVSLILDIPGLISLARQ